jgi:iron complex outermembrane receptor protein
MAYRSTRRMRFIAKFLLTGAAGFTATGTLAQEVGATTQPTADAVALQDTAPTPRPSATGAAAPVAPGQTAAPADASFADIVVTANKRSESIQRVPISVVAVTPIRLTEAGIVSTVQLQQTVPGLSFSPSGEAKLNSFYIRGVGTYALASTLESSVGVAVDGVPLARVGGSISDLVDIERVEVLKGPQGMLFGKNATAGLISVVSRKPELGVNGGQFNLSYGSFNELNVDAAANVALGDKAALRITGWRFAHDGFVKGLDGRDYIDKNSYGVRVGVTVEPVEPIRITLMGQYDGRDENGVAFTYRRFTNTPPFGSIVEPWEASRGIVPSETNLVADPGPTPRANASNYYVTGLVDADLGGGYTLSSVTSYRNVHVSGQMDPFLSTSPLVRLIQLDDDERYRQVTQELRIASPTDRRLSFVAGLFYYDFHDTDVQNQTFFGVPVPGVSRYARRITVKNSLRNIAAFGEATFRITPGIRVIAGIRQSNDKIAGALDRIRTGVDSGVVPASNSVFAYTPRDRSYNATSYRFGAQVDIAPEVMLYGTASRGYKAPGYNLTQTLAAGTVVDDTRVGAEIAKSYEIGLKSQFFDRRLTFNITGFHSIFSNFQTTVGLPTTPQVFVIQNAGELKSTGVELDMSVRPVTGLSFGLNGAYVNARYTDFNNAACYPTQPTLPVGSALQPGFCVGGVQTLDGFPLAQSPKWSFNATSRYETRIGNAWRGFISGAYSYRSRTYYEANRNPGEVQDPYGFFNLTVGTGPADEKITLSFYARNLFNVNFVSRVRQNFNSFYQLPAFEAQRRFGVQLVARF